jgi:signal peptidase I
MSGGNHKIVKEVGFSLLAEGKTLKVKADGYSMYPAIKPGSVIYIEPFIDEQIPAPGEIIAWKRDTGFVVHRLIRKVKEEDKICFITRGDSCVNEDKPVFREQIAGKVIRTEDPSGKRYETGQGLISKPGYLYNRILVWFIIRLNKVRNLVQKN